MYGITSSMFLVVNIVGPLVGGAVAEGLSFTVLYLVAGGLYSVAATIRVFMARYASRRDKQEQ